MCSLNRTQVLKWVGIGAIPVVTAVAGPAVVAGVVSTMGFGTGGIASGSVAAAMMSAQATTLGGGVAAGGALATLQSIGAAGLGVMGTTASMSGGAGLGVGIVAAFRKRFWKDVGDKEESIGFCSLYEDEGDANDVLGQCMSPHWLSLFSASGR